MKDLGTLGGNSSFATMINNRGQIIGESGDNILGKVRVPDSHAILWSLPSSIPSPEEQIKKLIEAVETLIRSGQLKKGGKSERRFQYNKSCQ
jgi:hypothetical protein